MINGTSRPAPVELLFGLAKRRRLTLLLVAFASVTDLLFAGNLLAQPAEANVPQAPPPAIHITRDASLNGPAYGSGPQNGPGQLWSIGQPSNEEQLYLEYINRSRANPAAEGQRLAATSDPDVLAAYGAYGVNLAMMQDQFNTNPAVPPLAMNAKLTTAARLHSQDMLTYAYQGHYETNNGTVIDLGTRLLAEGYNYSTAGENVFSYAKSVFYGHAGFNVDWGNGPGGMQNPPGHRDNIHAGAFREIGVGMIVGSNGAVGPQLVTQDFGCDQADVPFVTGVAYYDLNGNNFYDPGEGIGGLRVDIPASTYYALTAESGGYAVPVTSDGIYAVRFTGPGLSNQVTATVSSRANVKKDLVLTYTAPVPAGPNPANVNHPNLYTFGAVPGATNHQWMLATLAPYSAIEGAESGLANVSITPPGWNMLDSSTHASGSYSFAFSPDTNFPDLYLTLNPSLSLSPASTLVFDKQLGYAAATQTARAQISIDGGATWADLWSQAGNDGLTDPAFTTITIPLGAHAGQVAKFRFGFNSPVGGYYGSGTGLNVDNIRFTNADQVFNASTNDTGTASFTFTPTTATNYLLRVRPQIGAHFLPWGSGVSVNAQLPPPLIRLGTHPTVTASQVQIDFTVTNYRTGMVFELWKASAPNGTWSKDTAAAITTITPNTTFRATTPTGGATKNFYRVKGI